MMINMIEYYRALEQVSQQMLVAAQNGKWEHIRGMENECVLLIYKLEEISSVYTLQPTEQKERSHIMQRILRNDAEVRRLAEPCLGETDAGIVYH